ncbi:unnamed protein product [Peniophora sp. CBMAI 1063]|nr:unnamed protein product [Peniophora sp. CBMAI 1063]
MGASASALVNPTAPEAVSDPKLREQLDVLLKLTDARLDAYQKELEMMFVDGDSAAKRTVPGKRALRFSRYVGVDVGNKSRYTAVEGSEEVRHPVFLGVEDVVCRFFGIPVADLGKAEDKRALAIRGFASVVSNGLQAILENTSSGENTEKKFFVCIHHNAVIRIDVMTYRYNFTKFDSQTGAQTSTAQTPGSTSAAGAASVTMVGSYENIFGYVYCISVVDHREVTDDEIVFLASEFAGDRLDEFGAYLDQLIAVWGKLRITGPFQP